MYNGCSVTFYVQRDVEITINIVGDTVKEKCRPLFIRMGMNICDARLFHVAVFTWHSMRHDILIVTDK
jgi:hypothetical protein